MSGRDFFASEGPDAGDDISATPQVDDEQIFGSAVNPEGSAASIESAAEIRFSDQIEAELRERARKIQTVNNDPDIPDRFATLFFIRETDNPGASKTYDWSQYDRVWYELQIEDLSGRYSGPGTLE